MHSNEYRWSQVRVGLFVALTGILMFGGAVYIGLAGTPFARRAHIVAMFDDVAGLAVGSPVEMGGVVVGEVQGIDLPDIERGKVPVKLAIEERALSRLGTSSVAFNASHALVGQRYVGLTPRKSAETPLADGATIGTRSMPELDTLIAQVAGTLTDIRALASDARQFSSALADVARALESKEGTVGRLLLDDTLYNELLSTARTLRELSAAAQTGDGPIATLVGDKQLASNLKTGVDALSDSARRLNSGKGVLGRLTTEGPSAQALEKTLANLATVSSQLAHAEGTMGALISDPVLLKQMNALISQLDGLVSDVRRNPQRYLKIQAF